MKRPLMMAGALTLAMLAGCAQKPAPEAGFKSQSAASYVEAYGLRPDARGDVQVEITLAVTLLEISRSGPTIERWLGNIADVVGLTPEGDKQLGMRFSRTERLDGRDRLPLLTSIGMGTAPSGRYRLDVLVRELGGDRRTQVSREFTIGSIGESGK